jgi:site-specific DNA-methyltransferase (adenine-specific)
MIDLRQGDCLIESDKIESGSVDLILTDLPYGTVKGIKNVNHGMSGKCDWDIVIDTNKVMEVANRILRRNGKMILTAQQPFTNELINKALPNLPFNYSMIWEKDHFANALTAKKAPLNYYEDVLVFSKRNDKWDRDDKSELREYFYNILNKYGESKIFELIKKEGRYKNDRSIKAHLAIKFGNNNTRFDLMDQKLFNFLSDNGVEFSKNYKELKEIYLKHRDKLKQELNQNFPSTFNLWEGNKYKSNILKYKKDYTGHHPTQKPVLLLEDLIKTFSNENDLVVDLTMGSGSTMVACQNTNRKGIGIEMDENYFEIAKQRIKENEYKLF